MEAVITVGNDKAQPIAEIPANPRFESLLHLNVVVKRGEFFERSGDLSSRVGYFMGNLWMAFR